MSIYFSMVKVTIYDRNIIIAVPNICERFDSSFNSYIATSPAIDCTTINSNFSLTVAAHISTIIRWVMPAVRESRNTLINIGARHSGTMYMLCGDHLITSEFIMGNMVISVNAIASERGFSK